MTEVPVTEDSTQEFGIEQASEKIVFGVNIGYGFFLAAISLFGLIFVDVVGAVGVALGLVLVYIAWTFLNAKPVKKEGWMYAFIINIVTIPASYLLMPFPIYVYPITFAVLIIFIMIIPQIRAPYT